MRSACALAESACATKSAALRAAAKGENSEKRKHIGCGNIKAHKQRSVSAAGAARRASARKASCGGAGSEENRRLGEEYRAIGWQYEK